MAKQQKKKQKSIRDQALARVCKTPRDGNEIARLLGLKDYRSVSKVLGQAARAGLIERTPKGYVKVA